jgi:hypothetical protein
MNNSPAPTSVHHQPEVYEIQLKLAQYPILARKIRDLMRRELFAKRIIALKDFEAEVRQKAILSQHREGLSDPFAEEPANLWSERLAIVRDQLTDFYFAYNFPSERLEEIIQRVLSGRVPSQEQDLVLTFNPELAPWDLLFAQGQAYEALPPGQRAQVQHHLREIIVVLLKGMLSDQLEFIGIAKELFTIQDLVEIRRRCIGRGKIGGKAAGLLLARKILQHEDEQDPLPLRRQADDYQPIAIPDSYFIGADVFYDFQLINGFTRYMNQKYRPLEEIEADYPRIRDAYMEGHFPGEIIYSLRKLLEEVGDVPLVVRSSSLLEVHFGAALAGKYESVFCPNRGTLEENLAALMRAIAKVYASILSPDALFYRQRMGLVDYDERMAILIQKLQGTRYRRYLFPTVAGVGYSQNPFRWAPKIRREDGFLRLVCGFGTRAVQRVPNDYPRIVALSHPRLRPQVGIHKIRKYSQHFMDVVDLEDNAFKTLPVAEVLGGDYPGLRYVASLSKEDYLVPIISRLPADVSGNGYHVVLTFDYLTKDRRFVDLMHAILQKLERYHRQPVDIEFAVEVTRTSDPRPGVRYTVHLLQCRPMVQQKATGRVALPSEVPEGKLLFRATQLVPQGVVSEVRYIVYVDPEAYRQAPDYETKLEIARVVGRLNKHLGGTAVGDAAALTAQQAKAQRWGARFILIGPGRWGSSDVDLGVKVTYADVCNTKVLVEIPLARAGSTAEPSYGTHFFQDLIETGIFPLPIMPGERGTRGKAATFNAGLITDAPNCLPVLLPADAAYAAYVHVMDVPGATAGHYLEVVMDGEQEEAVGYLKRPSSAPETGA